MSSRELYTGSIMMVFSVLGLVYLGFIGALWLYTAGESFAFGMVNTAVPFVYPLLGTGIIGLGLVVGCWIDSARTGRLSLYTKLAIAYGVLYGIFLALKASNDILTSNSPFLQLADFEIIAAGPAVVMIFAIMFYTLYASIASRKIFSKPKV
jgi:hypothetical protein